MKVFEIIERDNDDGSTAGTDPVTDFLPGVDARELPTTGNAAADAAIAGTGVVGAAGYVASRNNPSSRITKEFLIDDMQYLEDGNIKANILVEDPNAPGGTRIIEFEGQPKDMAGIIEGKLGARSKSRFVRKMGKAGQWVARKTAWIASNTFFGILGGGISVIQTYALWEDYKQNIAMLAIIMEEGYLDNASSRYIAERAHNYYTYAFWTAASTELVGTVVSTLTASKVLRLARAVRAGLLVIPGAGWVVALVTTALMEGGIYLVSWFINKYGPAWLADTFTEEWSVGDDRTSEFEPINLDDPEFEAAMQQDVENPQSDFDQSSIDRISQAVRDNAGPANRVSVGDAVNYRREGPNSGSNAGSWSARMDRIRAAKERGQSGN